MVEVTNSQGVLLSLPLTDVSDGLVVQEIEGLDPVKATLVSSSFARLDGEQYQSSRRESRNIKIKLGLEPDYISATVRDLRKQLYQFFMPKSEVDLRFYMSDGPNLDIIGRVESFETALFSREPAVDISLMCFDPDFYDPLPVFLNMLTTDSITDTPVLYDGSVETGVKLTLHINRTIDGFTIYHRLSDNVYRSMEFFAPLLTGDVVTISTVQGAKGATLNRAGVEQSILYGVAPQANWMELMPGENNIVVYTEGEGIPFEFEYVTKYGGL